MNYCARGTTEFRLELYFEQMNPVLSFLIVAIFESQREN